MRNSFKIKSLTILAIVLVSAIHVDAQTYARLGLMVDGGASFYSGKSANTITEKAGIGYSTTLQFRQHFNDKVVLETGLGLTWRNTITKGFIVFPDSLTKPTTIDFKDRQQFAILNVPLQLSILVYTKQNFALWVNAGFRYGFVINSKIFNHQLVTQYDFQNQAQEKEYNFTYKQKVGLVKNIKDPINDYLFNVAGVASVTMLYKNHFQVRLFYDYSLYDLDAMPSNSSTQKLNYVGFGLGYLF